MFLKNCWYVAARDHDLIAPVTVRKPHQIGIA
jgi:hypothetical protein